MNTEKLDQIERELATVKDLVRHLDKKRREELDRLALEVSPFQPMGMVMRTTSGGQKRRYRIIRVRGRRWGKLGDPVEVDSLVCTAIRKDGTEGSTTTLESWDLRRLERVDEPRSDRP